MFVLFSASSVSIVLRIALGALIAACFAIGGFAARALTRTGAIATILVGAIVYGFGSLSLAAALVMFFASGSLLSRINAARKSLRRSQNQIDTRRNAAQVFANGGVAALLAIASGLAARVRPDLSATLLLSAIGAVAAASGDTWSTEIGMLLGRRPHSILSWEPVATGASGGVTFAGTIAAPLGGLAVALAGWLVSARGPADIWLAVGLAAGLMGSLFDSILGATVQALWRCETCAEIMETPAHFCGSRGRLVRGWAWLDNDGVNAAASTVGAATGFALAWQLH